MTEIKPSISGSDILPKRKITNTIENIEGKIGKVVKSTETSSPTGSLGAESLPPIENSFMYIETSSNNQGANVFCSYERTDIIQITTISFYYNRFSISNKDSLKSMGRFRTQLKLEDNTWSTKYTISKNEQYTKTSTDWTLLK